MAIAALEGIEPVKAKHGEKMIELRVRLWTDQMAEGEGEIVPKHAWGGGTVAIESNPSHGIRSGEHIHFNSMAQLPAAIERALIDSKVVIHKSRRERKYRQ